MGFRKGWLKKVRRRRLPLSRTRNWVVIDDPGAGDARA